MCRSFKSQRCPSNGCDIPFMGIKNQRKSRFLLSKNPSPERQSAFYKRFHVFAKNPHFANNPHSEKHSTFRKQSTFWKQSTFCFFEKLSTFDEKVHIVQNSPHNWQSHKLLEILPNFCGSEKKWQLRLQNDQFCKTIHLCRRIHISKKRELFWWKSLKMLSF